MATNYFRRRNLEKLLFCFLSDRPKLVTDIKHNCKEYGKSMIISYKFYRGSEWLKVNSYDKEHDILHEFVLYATGKNAKAVMLDETQRHEEDEHGHRKTYMAYYYENFCFLSGEQRLCCETIRKTA